MVASLLSTALTMSLVLAVSVFLYGTFYFAYMPVELVNMPVSRKLSLCGRCNGVYCYKVSLEFEPCEGQTSARCSFPTATVALGGKQHMLQGQVRHFPLVFENFSSSGVQHQDGAGGARFSWQ